MSYFCLLISLMLCYSTAPAQVSLHSNTMKSTERLLVGLDNSIDVKNISSIPVKQHQIKAFLTTPNTFLNNLAPKELELEWTNQHNFIVHPDSIGSITFHIYLPKDTLQQTMVVQYLTAVCRVGRFKATQFHTGQAAIDKKITKAALQQQLGVTALVECCGFDAKCTVTSFEIIHIDNAAPATRLSNNGGRFSVATQALLQQASSGDIYIFRKIYYRCPATPIQRGQDILLEVE